MFGFSLKLGVLISVTNFWLTTDWWLSSFTWTFPLLYWFELSYILGWKSLCLIWSSSATGWAGWRVKFIDSDLNSLQPHDESCLQWTGWRETIFQNETSPRTSNMFQGYMCVIFQLIFCSRSFRLQYSWFVILCCRKPFPAGEKVTLNGSDYLCQECANAPPPAAPMEVHSRWLYRVNQFHQLSCQYLKLLSGSEWMWQTKTMMGSFIMTYLH